MLDDEETRAISRLLRACAPQPDVSIIVDEVHAGARRRRVRHQLASAAGVLAVLTIVGGVYWAAGQPSNSSTKEPVIAAPRVAAPSTTDATRSGSREGGCPETRTYPDGSMAIIEWVDFLQLNGHMYTSAASNTDESGPPATKADLGDIVARVTCSISELTSTYDRKIVGPYLEGNAAYLNLGTPIYAVHGYDPDCRVAAIVDGDVREYLVQRETARHSQTDRCALPPEVHPG